MTGGNLSPVTLYYLLSSHHNKGGEKVKSGVKALPCAVFAFEKRLGENVEKVEKKDKPRGLFTRGETV